MGSPPGTQANSRTIYKNPESDTRIRIKEVFIGDDYLQTLGLELVAGESFEAHRRDSSANVGVILNEAAASELGMEKPIGQRPHRYHAPIRGVVRDYHFEPLHLPIAPLSLVYWPQRALRNVMIRLAPNQMDEGLTHLEVTWNRFVPGQPPVFAFLDDELDQAYRAELRLKSVFGSFTLLAIIIACLGLFSLAALTTEQRTKEIGVRKVMGASTMQIVFFLSKEFVQLVLMAIIIAFPIAYVLTNTWLQNFAYHTAPRVSIFFLVGLGTLLIALLTVTSQSIKASRANPVDTLRYE